MEGIGLVSLVEGCLGGVHGMMGLYIRRRFGKDRIPIKSEKK
jgi:hypothetical protein